MSELRPPCVCPRPTAQIEAALDRLTEFEQNAVITTEMRQYRSLLERQLSVFHMRPGPIDQPHFCVVCHGVRA